MLNSYPLINYKNFKNYKLLLNKATIKINKRYVVIDVNLGK